MTTTDTTAATAFARFAAQPVDIPEATLQRARIHLLDTLGAAIAGSASQEAAISRAVAAGSPGAAPLWGTPATAAPLAAAFGNGVAAHAFELDDSGGCDHSGAVVVPAVFAAAATGTPVDGRTALEAVVLGYELGRRVQTAMGGYDALNAAGWHSTGVCGTFAAAAASGRALRLTADQLTHAIGLAGSFTGGTWAFIRDGAMAKKMHVGRAAETGLHCALLARAGFTGPSDVFEAPWGGVLRLYGGTAADPTALVAGLGEEWQVDRASIKPHASCRSTHAAVDTLLDLLADRRINWRDITAIEVLTSALIADMCGGRDLGSMVAAQLSMPFALATAAVHGGVALADVAAAGRADERVRSLMALVTVVVDPAQEGGSALPVLRVRLRDGSVIDRAAGPPRGGWTNRLPLADTVAKFHALAGTRLAADRTGTLAEVVLALDDVADIGDLTPIMTTDDDPELVS